MGKGEGKNERIVRVGRGREGGNERIVGVVRGRREMRE